MKGFRGPLKKILGVCAVRPGGILFKPDVQLSADSARAVSFFVHAPVCFGFPFPPANRLCLGRRHRVRGHGLHPPLEPVSARLYPPQMFIPPTKPYIYGKMALCYDKR